MWNDRLEAARCAALRTNDAFSYFTLTLLRAKASLLGIRPSLDFVWGIDLGPERRLYSNTFREDLCHDPFKLGLDPVTVIGNDLEARLTVPLSSHNGKNLLELGALIVTGDGTLIAAGRNYDVNPKDITRYLKVSDRPLVEQLELMAEAETPDIQETLRAKAVSAVTYQDVVVCRITTENRLYGWQALRTVLCSDKTQTTEPVIGQLANSIATLNNLLQEETNQAVHEAPVLRLVRAAR